MGLTLRPPTAQACIASRSQLSAAKKILSLLDREGTCEWETPPIRAEGALRVTSQRLPPLQLRGKVLSHSFRQASGVTGGGRRPSPWWGTGVSHLTALASQVDYSTSPSVQLTPPQWEEGGFHPSSFPLQLLSLWLPWGRGGAWVPMGQLCLHPPTPLCSLRGL